MEEGYIEVFVQFFKKLSKINILLIFILLYVVFYWIVGQRGIIAYYQTSRDISLLRSLDTSLNQQLDDMTYKIQLLQPGKVDRDYLQELAGTQLGLFSHRYVRVASNNTERRN